MANDSHVEFGDVESLNAVEQVEGHVSSVERNFNRSTRKRNNSDKINPSKETPIKRTNPCSIVNSSTASGCSTTDISNLESELNSSIEKNDSSIADLPCEVLDRILQNVEKTDLLICRQINRHWNEIASRIIRKRCAVVLRFFFDKEHFMEQIEKRPALRNMFGERHDDRRYNEYYEQKMKTLADLVDCLKGSINFPCTSFLFNGLENFHIEEMRDFLSIWGQNIHKLNLYVDDPENSVGMLKSLLLDKVPNLKEFQIQFCPKEDDLVYNQRFPSTIQLFDIPNELQLPQLKRLCVDRRYRKFRGIVEKLLEAACNLEMFLLKQCQYLYKETMTVTLDQRITAADLAMLQSANKMHCLKVMEIIISEQFMDFWEQSMKIDDLNFKWLAVSLEPSIWENSKLKSRAVAVLNQLFHSTKEVIEKLEMTPLGSLPGLIIPKMEKLTALELYEYSSKWAWADPVVSTVFPPLFEIADHFPNLNELESHLPWNDFYFPAPLKLMPNIVNLRIFLHEANMTAKYQQKLLKATPNVTTLVMVDGRFEMDEDDSNFMDRFRAIPQNLTKLKNFRWLISKWSHHDLHYSLDAAITGFTPEFCKKILAKFRSKKRLPDNVAVYQSKRMYPSILNLKELERFDVLCVFDLETYANRNKNGCDEENEFGFNSEQKFHKTGFTKVSEFLAFSLMPNLKIKTQLILPCKTYE